MHDAVDWCVSVVADWVGEFLRLCLKLGCVGHELPRDRVVRIGRVDQLSHRRRDRDRILRSDFFEGGVLFGRR